VAEENPKHILELWLVVVKRRGVLSGGGGKRVCVAVEQKCNDQAMVVIDRRWHTVEVGTIVGGG